MLAEIAAMEAAVGGYEGKDGDALGRMSAAAFGLAAMVAVRAMGVEPSPELLREMMLAASEAMHAVLLTREAPELVAMFAGAADAARHN